jgi:hypothetical protein
MVDELFAGRLLDGKRILWSGKPGQGLLLTGQDIFLIPFSLLWFGFAIFWTVGVSRRAPDFFILWSGMFICIGLYFVVGRFFVDAWMRRGLRYAVTDRRILIARPAPFSRFTTLGLGQLPEGNLKESANGRGTIRFGQPGLAPARGFTSMTPALDAVPQFLAIDDARRVFDLIQRTAGKRQ